MNWCHVLQCVDFEAKTSRNLVPRVPGGATFVRILKRLSDDPTPRNFAILFCVKSHHYAISQSANSTVVGDGYVIVLI